MKDIVLHWQPTPPLNSSNLKTIVFKNIKHWLNQEICTMSTTCKINLLIMTEVVTTSIMLLIGRRFLIHFCNLVLGDEPKKQLDTYLLSLNVNPLKKINKKKACQNKEIISFWPLWTPGHLKHEATVDYWESLEQFSNMHWKRFSQLCEYDDHQKLNHKSTKLCPDILNMSLPAKTKHWLVLRELWGL